jgi:hypothetical protein
VKVIDWPRARLTLGSAQVDGEPEVQVQFTGGFDVMEAMGIGFGDDPENRPSPNSTGPLKLVHCAVTVTVNLHGRALSTPWTGGRHTSLSGDFFTHR